jgi:predicted ferric reductase
MTESTISNRKNPAQQPNKLHAALLAALVLLLLAAAAAIPFVYESTTLWYKFGIDRILLLAGQVVGLITLVFFGLQLLLAARFGVIDRIVGVKRVLKLHQMFGLLIMLLALSHALLILIPEGLDNLPFGWKYWPEMIGAFVFVLLCLHVGSAFYRTNLGLAYQQWRLLHRLIGYSLFLGLNCHVLFVSTSFAQGPPRYALVIFSGAVMLSLILQKAYRFARRS